MRENKKWCALALAFGAVAVMMLGACSSDSKDNANASEAGTTTSAPSDAPDADVATFCSAISELGLGLSQGEGNQADVDILESARNSAPAEIGADLATMTKQARAEAAAAPRSEGTPMVVPPDEFFVASTAVGDYMAHNCGYQVIDVTATNYVYDGVPTAAKKGRTLIRLTNKGTEYHEVIVQRVHDGETRSVKQLLALPEQEGADLLDFVGNAFAPPGLGNWTVMDLVPGRNAVMCLIPTGSTPASLQRGEVTATAPSHARKGMVAEMQIS